MTLALNLTLSPTPISMELFASLMDVGAAPTVTMQVSVLPVSKVALTVATPTDFVVMTPLDETVKTDWFEEEKESFLKSSFLPI